MANAKIPAEVIATELETIREDNGGKLRAADVVATAEPETALLHPLFTWNDQTAAHEYRLWEARQLIRTVTVTVNDRKVAKYYNVPETPRSESFYLPSEILIEQPDEFERAFEQLVQKVHAAQRSLEDLKHAVAQSKNESGNRATMISLALQAFAAATAAIERIQ